MVEKGNGRLLDQPMVQSNYIHMISMPYELSIIDLFNLSANYLRHIILINQNVAVKLIACFFFI